jgi:ABC-type nitrate/sulfonate/bicarbonate transport system permease component
MTSEKIAQLKTGRPESAAFGRLRAQLRARESLILGVSSVVFLVVLWEVAARLRWVNPGFSSQPSAVLAQFVEMYFRKKDVYFHLWVSLQEAGIGFFFALIVGVSGGLVLGRMKRVRHVVEPYVMAMYSTPTVALFPLLIFWFGIGITPKILLVFLGGVFSILVNTQTGVENTDARLIETARAFRASEWQIFRKVMLPSAIPYILAGVRLAIGRCLIMMFVSEMVIANQGIGFIINEASSTFRADRMFVGILTLTILGMVLSQIIRTVEVRRFGYLRQD